MPTTTWTSRNSWSSPSAPRASPRPSASSPRSSITSRPCSKKGHNTAVGDEGGFAPNLDNEEAIEVILAAIDKAGYKAGTDDVPGPRRRLHRVLREGSKKGYKFWKSARRSLTARQMVELFVGWVDKYPIVSIEDPLARTTGTATRLTQALGDKGPDRRRRLLRHQHRAARRRASQGCANSILIKVNQIGTLTETLEAVQMAQRTGYTNVISHRSGETEDATIADIAVATNAGQIKTGSASRSDRIAKYNQLLRIEEELGKDAVYGPGPKGRR